MTNEEIIRYTRYLAKKHEDDTVLTFETNFHMAFTDIANHIENQAKYNTELELMIEMYKQLVSEQSDLNIEQFKQIDEQTQAIDNYNKALQSWNDANNNLLRLVGDLKDEINGLKELKIAQPINFNKHGYNECPTCKFSVDTDDSYCSNCGQKIYLKMEE